MSESNARVLARNTYSLDVTGVLAHLRDTAAAYLSNAARSAHPTASGLPRSHTGPAQSVIERHNVTDAWRLR